MKSNHKKLLKLLIVATVTFCLVLTGCGGGGGGTGGGGSSKRTYPEMAILSVNNGTLGQYNSSSVSRVNNGSSVIVTIGVNTAAAIDTCGYQCALEYDSSKFTPDLNIDTVKADLLKAFDVTIGQDSKNANIVRVVAVPKTRNGNVSIAKQSTKEMVQLKFTAKDKGNARFILQNQDGFATSISKYRSSQAVSVDDLTLGSAMSVTVR